MAQNPEKSVLLEALAEFLLTEVRPMITESKASFDVLVAANHASILAAAIREEDAAARAQIRQLQQILPDVKVIIDETSGTQGRMDALHALNAVLVDRLKTGLFLDDQQRAAAWSHVTEGLRQRLGETVTFMH